MPLLRVALLVEGSSALLSGRRIEAALRGAIAALGGGVIEITIHDAPASAVVDARRAKAPTRRMAPAKPRTPS